MTSTAMPDEDIEVHRFSAHVAFRGDCHLIVFTFTEDWQRLIRQPGQDSNAILMSSSKRFPLCTGWAQINPTFFSVSLNPDQLTSTLGVPTPGEIREVASAFLLVLEELSGHDDWECEIPAL